MSAIPPPRLTYQELYQFRLTFVQTHPNITLMKLQLTPLPFDSIKSEVIALPIFEDNQDNYGFEIVGIFLKSNPKFGKLYETQMLYTKDQNYLLVGAGRKEKFGYLQAQNVSGTAAKLLLDKSKDVTFLVINDFVEATALGVELAAHDPSQSYKSEKSKPMLEIVRLVIERNTKESQDALKKAILLSEGINLARHLGDMPANEMTPTYLLNMARKTARENRLKITVLDEKQAKKKGMGAFVGVAQGSDEPSYMIALEYNGDIRSKEKWGLIGKGVTFDTGGISIKPAASMHEMKYDMSGAADVLAVLQIVSKLKLKTNVVGVMAVTENLSGGRAQRPGDIVKTYSGKTAEVLNTDAEGRLVIVDALTYAQRDFKATKLIDLATLTGAMIVALGNYITGVFGNNPGFTQQIMVAGSKVGEKYWELPMDEEYDEMIKSDVADIANIGHGGSMPGAAGSITGAKFIAAVIEDERPWVHLDIAGTAWDMKPRSFRGAGATGFGVKTLVNLMSLI